jgi:hypothetical protein
MTRWVVRLRYQGEDKRLLEATAHADGENGHEAIVRAIDAVKEQAPGITVIKVEANPLRESASF